jgi:hypothetical protein
LCCRIQSGGQNFPRHVSHTLPIQSNLEPRTPINVGDPVTRRAAQASGVGQPSYELPLKGISNADPFYGNMFGWRRPHPPLAARLARLVCGLGGCPFSALSRRGGSAKTLEGHTQRLARGCRDSQSFFFLASAPQRQLEVIGGSSCVQVAC